MDKKVFDIFDNVHADDELKKKTIHYLYAEIEKGKREGKVRGWRAVLACAVFALLLLCGGVSGRLYFTPDAYIDIDVNPSIELAVNRFGRVIRSNAYNDDGQDILSRINVRYAGYGEAVERLLDTMAADGYLKKESLLCVTVQANESGRESSILDGLYEAIDAAGRKRHHHIAADVYTVTEEVKQCASEDQISPAKYLAIQDLLEVDSETDVDECKEHSVYELRQMAHEKCGEHEHDSGSCVHEGTGRHH